MSKYHVFLAVFIISVISMIVFFVLYIQAIFGFALNLEELESHSPNPFHFLSTIFSPAVIISGVVFGISSLLCRILGIVYIARSQTVSDGEKALWIIGFIIMGFITAIVFLVMAKGRRFVD